jgi:Meiotically up-regulated gene 113
MSHELESRARELIHPEIYQFVKDDESGGICAIGRGGVLMTSDKAKELFDGVLKFCAFYGDDNILAASLAKDEEAEHEADLAIRGTNYTREKTDGVVYFLRAENGLVKIGMSTRPANERLMQFSPKLPFETELIHTIECKKPLELEKHLHALFSDKRKCGEWFDLNNADIEYIKAI